MNYHRFFLANRYGQGAYFGAKSCYSAKVYADDSGMKRMYQALVLTGDYTIGIRDMRVLPSNPANPGFSFDSAVNDMDNPDIFVVFLDNMAYPEYLITFK